MGLSGKGLWRCLLSNGVNARTYMGGRRLNVSHQDGIYLVSHPSQPAPTERYRELCWKPHMLQGSYWGLLSADVSVPSLKLHIWEMSYSGHFHAFFFFNIVEISIEGASKVALDTRASYIFWEQDNYLHKQLSSLWGCSFWPEIFFKLATNGDFHPIMMKYFSSFCFSTFYLRKMTEC